MQTMEEAHHRHYLKELTVAVVLASVAVLALISSALCAWIVWRRSRQMLDSKDIERSGPLSEIIGDAKIAAIVL